MLCGVHSLVGLEVYTACKLRSGPQGATWCNGEKPGFQNRLLGVESRLLPDNCPTLGKLLSFFVRLLMGLK